MQNSDEKNGDRLSKVNKRQKLGIVQYLLGLAQIPADNGNGSLVGEQAARLVQDFGVVIDVDNLGVPRDQMRDRVDLAESRQPAPDVHDLAYRRAGAPDEVADGAAEELPFVIAGHAGVRDQLKNPLGGLAISLVVVLSAKQVIVDTRRVGSFRLNVTGWFTDTHRASFSCPVTVICPACYHADTHRSRH